MNIFLVFSLVATYFALQTGFHLAPQAHRNPQSRQASLLSSNTNQHGSQKRFEHRCLSDSEKSNPPLGILPPQPDARALNPTPQSGLPRIAIVGAGPGGLAAALFLAKKGIPTTVYERLDRDAYSTERGSAIGLGKGAQRILGHISPDLLKKVFSKSTQTVEGQLLVKNSQLEIKSEPAAFIYWFNLLNLLYDETKTYPDLIQFQFDRKLESIEMADFKKTLHFKEQKNATSTEKADWILGADGHRSVVFNYLNPTKRLPYSGQVYYRGQSKISDPDILNRFNSKMQDKPNPKLISEIPTLSKLTYAFDFPRLKVFLAFRANPQDPNSICWSFVLRESEYNQFKNKTEMFQHLIEVSKQSEMPDFITKILENSESSQIIRHPLYTGDDDSEHRTYSVIKNQTLLIGDATGPASPIGFGIQMALESAYIASEMIHQSIQNETPVEQSYENFYNNRLLQIKKISNHPLLQSLGWFGWNSIDPLVKLGFARPIEGLFTKTALGYKEALELEDTPQSPL